MNRKMIIQALGLLVMVQAEVAAQTGTRIEGAGGKMPETVIWYTEPTEITDIRLLLQSGEKQRAVDKARAFVSGIQYVSGVEARVRMYFGLNALCAALTSTGELQEAIANCDKAIDIFPTRWQALNNRGVANFMAGQTGKALQDYQQALDMVQNSEPLTELIQHNIALAESKQQNQGS
jgi:Flp pilus assembly protein TadD